MSQLSIFDMVTSEPVAVSEPVKPVVMPVPAFRHVSADTARREFIREFRHIAPYHRRWDVFSDFIALAASDLDMARIHTAEANANAARIYASYKPDDMEKLKNLFSLLVDALTAQFQDFLGSVFMELELGSGDMGQYFTPYPVSQLLTGVLTGDMHAQLKTCPYITLSEPTSGAGGMVIAYAEAMRDAGLNPSEQLLVITTDIDPVAADMTFIQLSLLGIPAIVHTGNTLSLQVSRTRCTPVYYINDFPKRVREHERIQAMLNFIRNMG
ncbi:N-6 DNA methylase [Siccibacter turicensis]|uniref:N-6 DNA methylase n=1 Tax=Siccibacter turicensis TaxID=357233 RepID=UPI00102168D2|nr:N-6 DNA methylase [Siccibacter turicensis]